MAKNIFIIFSILLSISLMFFISLSNGIRLGDFSYENISVKGLYLKYDEKIIIDTENVLVYNINRTKSTDFKIKFSIENFFDQYFIHVEKFLLHDPFLKISGDIVLNPRKINLDTISKLYFNNFSIQFSRNLKPVIAEKCFVQYENNNFHFTFLHPKYGLVSIKDSSVSINNYEYVLLNIQSKDKLNSEVLELLSNYKVNVPVQQIEGTNTTEVKVKLPFDIKEDIDVHSNINLDTGKILLYDIPLYVDSMKLKLDNNLLKGTGKLLKPTLPKEVLSYDIDNQFEIDFRKAQVTGDFLVHQAIFETIATKGTSGSFLLDFDKEFFADIFLKEASDIVIKNQPFKLKEFSSHYTDDNKTFSSNIQLQHSKKNLQVTIADNFELKKLQSTGNLNLDYLDQSSTITMKDVFYETSFKKKFYLTFKDTDTVLNHDDTNIQIENLQGSFFDGKLHGKLLNTDIKNSKYDLLFQNVDLTINDIDDIQISSPFVKSLRTQLPVTIQDIDLHIKNKKANYSSLLDNKHTIQGELDLTKGDIKGILNYENESIDFDGNIFDNTIINIPKLQLTYNESSNDAYTLEVKKPHFLKNFYKYLSFNDNSSILVKKQDKNHSALIDMNHVDLDILTLEDEKKDVSEQNLLRSNINWENSSFKIGKYNFPFHKTDLKLNNGIVSGNMFIKNNSNINIKKDINELIIVSNNLTSEYVNNIFQKNYFKDGNFELFLTKKTIDSYEGIVKINGVTFKEMQFVDNLLLFVNSSPALINPFLALPTFVRFGMNGFKVDGYHVVEGSFNFVYHRSKNILDILNIKTIGNINNFNGDISVNLNNDSISGELNIAFLKDFATIIKNIPLLGTTALNKDGEIALPITISGTLKDPSFSVKNN